MCHILINCKMVPRMVLPIILKGTLLESCFFLELPIKPVLHNSKAEEAGDFKI